MQGKKPGYRPEGHSKWRGGKTISTNGYLMVRSENHPYASVKGHYVAKHRLVMEKSIGRFLKTDEVVHHKNGNKLDNRLCNLEITNHSDHISEHNKNRVWKEESKEKHRQKSNRLKRNKYGRFTCKK